jgi:hypothetical protein
MSEPTHETAPAPDDEPVFAPLPTPLPDDETETAPAPDDEPVFAPLPTPVPDDETETEPAPEDLPPISAGGITVAKPRP